MNPDRMNPMKYPPAGAEQRTGTALLTPEDRDAQ